MVRPLRYETERFGEYSKPGEFVYDHPFLWGSRRIGPDLARIGGKYPDLWHIRHFAEPKSLVANSIMPVYAHLEQRELDFDGIQRRVDAMVMLGVPYGEAVRNAPAMARAQAEQMAAGIEASGGPSGLADKEVIALVAYLQRLGRDIQTPTGTASAAGARPRERRREAHRRDERLRALDVRHRRAAAVRGGFRDGGGDDPRTGQQ